MSKSKPGERYFESVDQRTPQQSRAELVDTRKSSFAKLCRLIQHGGGFVTSYPGLPYVSFDALPDSSVPQKLRDLGYAPIDEGETERIVACGITERLTRTSSGALEPATEGSTKPIELRHHVGICKVRRYTFDL
jgi:hypothetical protein